MRPSLSTAMTAYESFWLTAADISKCVGNGRERSRLGTAAIEVITEFSDSGHRKMSAIDPHATTILKMGSSR